MEILTSQKYCILTPLSQTLDGYQVKRLVEEIKNYKNLTVGIDLNFVEDCTIEFLDALKELKIACFNIHSDIFSIFNLTNMDKIIPLYTTEEDFRDKKHRLINRNLQLVK